MTALAFGFTKLIVEDLDTIEDFYCKVFGMQCVRRVTADEHEYALEEAILSLGGAANSHALIITRYLHRPCPPAGAAWTGFTVSDIAATLVDAARAGGSITVPPHDNPDYGVRAAIVADPEGHLIEIIQMMTAAA